MSSTGSKFILDEKGNLVDENGNIVPLNNVRPVATSLANKRHARDHQQKKPKSNPFIPSAVAAASANASQQNSADGQDKKKVTYLTTREFLKQRKQDARAATSSTSNEEGTNNSTTSNVVASEPAHFEKIVKPKLRKKAFQFYEQGEKVREAKLMRSMEEHDKKLAEDLVQRQAQEAIDAAAAAALRVAAEKLRNGQSHLYLGIPNTISQQQQQPQQVIPDIEWWDAAIVNNAEEFVKLPVPSSNTQSTAMSDYTSQINEKLVCTSLIEQPQLKPRAEETPQTIYLTAKERKKIRTQTRVQREKEKQQKIRLGLLPPPPPKANLKNFMRVHLNDGTMDPTRLEKMIRDQIAQRVENHEKRNQDRKLSKDQKKTKKKKQVTNDANRELLVCAFRIVDFSHPQNRFKVTAKAKEFWMTGCVIECNINTTAAGSGGSSSVGSSSASSSNTGRVNIIIAEGGAKATRRFITKILNVNWQAPLLPKPQQQQDNPSSLLEEAAKLKELNKLRESNTCELMWKGVISQRSFRNFKIRQFDDEETAKKYLQANGYVQVWDMAKSKAKIEHNDDSDEDNSSDDDDAMSGSDDGEQTGNSSANQEAMQE